jgi:hypothetical protein
LPAVGPTQTGGLEGYNDDDYMYNYFDPHRRSYIQIKVYNPPAVPVRLDEAFSVVSFYKPLFQGHYQNTVLSSLPVLLIFLFFFLIGIFPLYLLLRVFADDYNSFTGATEKISHKLIGSNFLEITGYSALSVIGAAAVLLAMIVIVSSIVSGNILRKNKEIYGRYSLEYRERIKRRLSGEDKIIGRIVRRDIDYIKEYITRDETSMESRVRSSVTHRIKKYTIRFSGILDVPVYLSKQLLDDPDSYPSVKQLDELFADKKDTRPSIQRDVEFIVAPDYSIYLAVPEDPGTQAEK